MRDHTVCVGFNNRRIIRPIYCSSQQLLEDAPVGFGTTGAMCVMTDTCTFFTSLNEMMESASKQQDILGFAKAREETHTKIRTNNTVTCTFI